MKILITRIFILWKTLQDMNWIVVGFHSDQNISVIEAITKRFNIEKMHVFKYYENENKNFQNVKKIIIHDCHKIRIQAKYPISKNEMTPLDDIILKKLALCEVNTIKMMERLQRLGKEFQNTYDFRKNIYLNHVRYWNHVLLTEKIDLVIFDCIPHTNYTYILYNLCEIHNIPIITIFQLQYDITMFFDNYDEPCMAIKNNYKQVLEKYKEISLENIKLEGVYLDQYKRQTQKEDPQYFYMKNKQKGNYIYRVFTIIKKQLFQILKSIFSGHFGNYIQMVKKKNKERKLSRYFESLAILPDLNQKFIYYPLHYQPEMTSNPLGGSFVNQILIIYMIAYNLPKNVKLYVKEHPNQNLIARDKEFYNEIAEIPNVYLIKKSYNSIKLVENAKAVVTITGTAGWESIFRLKPVLLFGTIYYQYIKGVFTIRTNQELKDALDQILNKNYQVGRKNIKLFMKALETTTINAYIDTGYSVVSKLTIQENIDNLIEGLTKKIKEVLYK